MTGMNVWFGFVCLAVCVWSCAHSPTMVSNIENKEVGYASWYGSQFHGKQTASGELYDMNMLTAAHRKITFGQKVRVTNLSNGQSVVVKINDRGPFVRGRIVDLSYEAAKSIGLVQNGVAKVSVEPLSMQSDQNDVKQFIQLASFKNFDNATRFKEDLLENFSQDEIRIQQHAGFYRVYIGPCEDVSKCNELQEKLKNLGFETIILHQL